MHGKRPTGKHKLYFLFLANRGIDNEGVWRKFFAGADPTTYSVLVHCSDSTCAFAKEGPFHNCNIPTTTAIWCQDLVSPQNDLLKAAIECNDNACANQDNENSSTSSYILLAQDTIPVKPFAYIYDMLSQQRDTSWCFWKYSMWAFADPQQQSTRLPKTMWLIFNRRDAKAIVDSWMSRAIWNSADLLSVVPPSSWPEFGTSAWGCIDEYWHWAVLHNTTLPHRLNTSPPFEQGRCQTYVPWLDYIVEGSPFAAIDKCRSSLAGTKSVHTFSLHFQKPLGEAYMRRHFYLPVNSQRMIRYFCVKMGQNQCSTWLFNTQLRYTTYTQLRTCNLDGIEGYSSHTHSRASLLVKELCIREKSPF